MPDLETSVRRLLDDRAASLPDVDAVPPAVLRRARMRRLRSGAAASMMLVAVLFGGTATIGRLVADDATTDVVTQPPPSVDVTEPAPHSPEVTTPPSTVVVAPGPSTVVTPTTRPTPAATAAPTTTVPRVPPGDPVAYRDGVPQVIATPGAGKAGDRIRVRGAGFTDPQWQGPGKMLWLAGSGGCGVSAQAEHTIEVTAAGLLTGEFTVPARGECPQSDGGGAPVPAGRYRIAFACTSCFVGELDVVADPAAGAACANVGFTPNSDDVASSIEAWNMTCAEAEALVRKVGPDLGYNAAPTAEADGFRCVRTGQEDRYLPMAFYECTNGAKRITFTRT